MAAETVLRSIAWLPATAAVALALAMPVPAPRPPASQSPQQAAARAEREMPSLGLGWGRLRGWERRAGGWRLVWQPTHGAWLVEAWVTDAPAPVRWRAEAAPWLPGVRLTRAAAELLSGGQGEVSARERLGRRDWLVGERRLLGALPAGGALPAADDGEALGWKILLAACLVAGAITRAAFPGVAARSWRRGVMWAALGLAVVLPFSSSLGVRFLQTGVRPWVGELAFMVAAAVLVAAVAVAAVRYPAKAGPASAWLLPLCLGLGALAGRFQPSPWVADVGGVSARLLLLIGIAVLGGWLAGLAGEGLREVLEPLGWGRLAPLALVAAIAVQQGGAFLGPVGAVLLAAAGPRGHATWSGIGFVWGWLAGALLASCAFEPAVRDAIVLLLLGATAVAVVVARGPRAAASGAR